MKVRRVLVGVLTGLAWCASTRPAAAERCPIISELSGGVGGARLDLSDTPVRVCSVEFIATAANGFAQVIDSPNDLETHAQARNTSEPGAAAAGDWVSGWFGEEGRRTRFGLDLLVNDGRVIVTWGAP